MRKRGTTLSQRGVVSEGVLCGELVDESSGDRAQGQQMIRESPVLDRWRDRFLYCGERRNWTDREAARSVYVLRHQSSHEG
jgi:hypothetical protein